METDPHGNIWLSLSVVDVSSDQNVDRPAQSRLVHQETGEIFISESDNGQTDRVVGLSGREAEVLQLIAEGQSSKQIADHLTISIHTVNTHRQNIIEKLNVSNTAEAIHYAVRLGFLN